jgi:hypothetical protein
MELDTPPLDATRLPLDLQWVQAEAERKFLSQKTYMLLLEHFQTLGLQLQVPSRPCIETCSV